MRMIILKPVPVNDSNLFVKYWKDFYDEQYIPEYEALLKIKPWDAEHVERLFLWKNNMKKGLNAQKKQFVQSVTKKMKVVNQLRDNFNIQAFKEAFGSMGPVWGITLLHAICPEEYPIFDQHVYRAYNFIAEQEIKKIPLPYKIYNLYFGEYVPFFQTFYSDINEFTKKETDNALWAFGKFLSTHRKMSE